MAGSIASDLVPVDLGDQDVLVLAIHGATDDSQFSVDEPQLQAILQFDSMCAEVLRGPTVLRRTRRRASAF